MQTYLTCDTCRATFPEADAGTVHEDLSCCPHCGDEAVFEVAPLIIRLTNSGSIIDTYLSIEVSANPAEWEIGRVELYSSPDYRDDSLIGDDFYDNLSPEKQAGILAALNAQQTSQRISRRVMRQHDSMVRALVSA